MSRGLNTPGEPLFPALPIVTPDPVKRPDSERFGALFYLGLAGLFVLAAMLAWFAWGAWNLRTVFADIYILHSSSRSEAERAQAAFQLSQNPRATQAQLWEIALRKRLPDVARYVVAEALTAEVTQQDPRGYALSVARSEGWPDWLRTLLARPLAYAATVGQPIDRAAVAELARRPEPSTRLWACYALAVATPGDPAAAVDLRRAAQATGPEQRLARRLVEALDAPRVSDRLIVLDGATVALRNDDPPAAQVWSGWQVRGHRLMPRGQDLPARQ